MTFHSLIHTQKILLLFKNLPPLIIVICLGTFSKVPNVYNYVQPLYGLRRNYKSGGIHVVLCLCVLAVSYTHLDVYKRQVHQIQETLRN